MDLTFQEKSAWGLLAGIGLVSFFYFPAAFEIAGTVPTGIPLIVISVVGVAALIIIEAIYHALIAVSSGSDGETDERDLLIDMRAERNASYVLGFGLFWLVGHIIATHSMPDREPVAALTIAVWVIFAITVSEMAKLLFQIWYYRTGS